MYVRFRDFSSYIAYAQTRIIKVHADVSRKNRGLNFGQSLNMYLYFVYMSRKALTSLCICTDSPEHSLLADAISTKTARADTC